MDNRTVMIGGLVAVAFFGLYVAQQRSAGEEAGVQRQLAAVDARIDALETTLASLSEHADGQAAMVAEIAALASELAGTVEALGSASAERTPGSAVEEAGAAAAEALAPQADAVAAAPAAPTPETVAAAPAAAAPETDPARPSAATRTGETAILADGAIRAFVSRVDEAEGTARLSINGVMTTVTLGETVPVMADGRDCRVHLEAIAGRSVDLGGDCGETVAAPAPAGAAAADGIWAEPAEMAQVGVGETALFAKGTVRVFLSRVDAAGGAAVVAVNGLDRTTIPVGATIAAADGCAVALSGLEGNRAALAFACEG